MMTDNLARAFKKCQNIINSKLTIYDSIEIGDLNLWYTSEELTAILNDKLVGRSLAGLPLRTRSKVSKCSICEALGYPIPKTFKKTQPRFTGQLFDTYVQKSNNLQIWNEELDPERRYVLIRTDDSDTISKVRVVTGADLAILDTTGTLTQKYQARLEIGELQEELISSTDTNIIQIILSKDSSSILLSDSSPIEQPEKDKLMPIQDVFEKLRGLVGETFQDTGHDQERNRGAALHRLICERLGYSGFQDNGQFPDIKHQLLEVKLQTSSTIDLGLVTPNSEAVLDIEKLNNQQIRHCDVRYAIFYGEISNGRVELTHFFLTTGKDFFSRFTQFGGKVLNRKIQIPLPKAFFL